MTRAGGITGGMVPAKGSIRRRERTDRSRVSLTRRPRCDREEPVRMMVPRIESGLGRSLGSKKQNIYQHPAVCMFSGFLVGRR